MFSIVDVILVLLVSAFVFFGFFFGFVHTLGSLVGTILGIVLSTRLTEPAFSTFGWMFGGGGFGKIVVFIIIFLLTSRIIGIAFWLFQKVFGIFGWIPFAGMINRILGAAFGLVEGIIFVGVVLFFALQYIPGDVLKETLSESVVANLLLAIIAALQILFPATTAEVTRS